MAFPALSDRPAPPICAGERRFARARLNVPARLVTFGGNSACTVIDVSCTGAKIKAGSCPRIGAMVVVEGLPFELFGTVRWTIADKFGLEFDTALPVEQVIAMRTHSDGERKRQENEHIAYARTWATGIR